MEMQTEETKKPPQGDKPSKPKLTGKEIIETLAKQEPRSPSHVMKFDSRAELKEALRQFDRPMIEDLFHTPFERRYFMEYMRPALKFWCKRLGVQAPEWLEGDTHYGHGEPNPEMGDDYMQRTFGVDHIEPARWDEIHDERTAANAPGADKAKPAPKSGSGKSDGKPTTGKKKRNPKES